MVSVKGVEEVPVVYVVFFSRARCQVLYRVKVFSRSTSGFLRQCFGDEVGMMLEGVFTLCTTSTKRAYGAKVLLDCLCSSGLEQRATQADWALEPTPK